MFYILPVLSDSLFDLSPTKPLKYPLFIISVAMNTLPIGLFDSGMGGLTVLHELKNHLPQESFLYLGDTARLPYGTKSQATVLHYAKRMASILIERGIKLLVIACNTATTAALPQLRQLFPEIPIIGVVEPGAQAAIAATRNHHVALLATETTIRSQVYQHALLNLDPNITISAQACGLFVALAEEGCIDEAITECAIDKYLGPLVALPNLCDTVILGCTHFPVLINPIKHFLGNSITVINSAKATADVVANTLSHLALLNEQAEAKQNFHYLVTDLPERFQRLGEIFLQHPIETNTIELVDHQQALTTK